MKMKVGPITEDGRFDTKLAYYISQNRKDGATYHEVHLYPARGENNLNGWTDIVNVEEEIRVDRSPEK